jgi:signal transduction histidine kinase
VKNDSWIEWYQIQKKIFEPFFTTKPAGEGSGLGLHIIGKILEKHNGKISLESEVGRTKFIILIPARLEN